MPWKARWPKYSSHVVGVGVQVDERERPVLAREDTELRERDRMVAAETERKDAGLDERREGLLGDLERHVRSVSPGETGTSP